MATEVGSAYLTIIPSSKGFGKKLSGQIDPEMGTAGKSAGSKFGSGLSSSAKGIGSKAGKLIGGAVVAGVGLAVVGIGAIIKTGFDESKDASAGAAQLAAGIKSTGNAANVAVPGMEALAKKIQAYSGQTDDSIVQTEALLLTFPKIKNAGVDKIFDQTTIAAADMAARMGGDASASAIRLGRALSDPVKGVTALTRVGVVFTAAQKDQIAAMVKVGDVVGAQKIILGELNTEFGGSAAAAGKSLPGAMAIAKRSFEELSETVVTGLLPAFTTTLTGINGFVQGVQSSFEKGGISQVFTDLGSKIGAAWPGIQSALARMGVALWAWVQDATPPMLVKMGELLSALGGWIWGTALPAIGAQLAKWGVAFWAWIQPQIVPMLTKLGILLGALGTWLLNVGVPWLGEHLKTWGIAFWAWIQPMIGPFLAELGKLLLKFWIWSETVAYPAITKKLAEWAWAFIKWVPGASWSLMIEIDKLLAKLVIWMVTVAAPAMRAKLGEWALAFIKWIPGAAVSMLVEFGKLLLKLGAWWVTMAIPAIVGWVAGMPGRIASAASGMFDGLKDAFRSAINWIIRKWNDLSFTIAGGNVMGVNIPSVTLNTPNIPLLAAGGIVPATPGGRLVRVAEGGRDEAIVPLGRGGATGGIDLSAKTINAIVAAMARVQIGLDGRVVSTSVDHRIGMALR